MELSTSTYSSGAAGNISLQASNISLSDARIFSNVEAGANADGGSISVAGRSLALSNDAQLQTLVRQAQNGIPAGQGRAGNVSIQVDNVTLSNSSIFSNLQDGTSGRSSNVLLSGRSLLLDNSSLQTQVGRGASGNAGRIRIDARDSVMFNDSFALSNIGDINGQGASGDAGRIRISTRSLSLLNDSQLQTQINQQSVGNAGNIVLDVSDTILFDDSEIFSSLGTGTSGGNGGTIRIGNFDGREVAPTGSLLILNGAQIIASTAGAGNAGDVNIFANTVRFDGTNQDAFPSAIFNGVDPGGTGRGGNVLIDARSLTVSDDALLTVSSFGFDRNRLGRSSETRGQVAGNMTIRADVLRIEDNGRIVGETARGDAGNLTFGLDRLLLMRGASQISTTAGTSRETGEGGNIRFTSGEGFLVGEPSGNNDIFSNAYFGSGGRVTVNAEGVVGFQFRSREDLVRLLGTNDPDELTPRSLPTSDITAVSQTSPDLNGEVTIEANTDDPTRGLAELPADLADASQLIVESCSADRVADGRLGEFTVTGRGGLPPNPIEPVGGDTVLTELASADAAEGNGSTPAISRDDAPLVEAQGWTIGANGEVALVAQAATVTPSAPETSSPECNAP